jgi:hypothetical protein
VGIKLLKSDVRISEHGFCFYVANKKEAIALIDSDFNDLAKIAYVGGFEATTINYPKCRKPTKIYATQYQERLVMPQSLNFGQCEIPHELLRYVYEMGESDSSQGLVRLADNRQIVLSEKSRLFTPDFEEVMKKTRADYWYAPDLEEFDREWKQALRPDGTNWITKTYRVFNHADPTDRDGWREFTSRYRLLLDDRGNTYQIGENLNVREILAPV